MQHKAQKSTVQFLYKNLQPLKLDREEYIGLTPWGDTPIHKVTRDVPLKWVDF